MKPVVSTTLGLTLAAMAASMPGLAQAAPTPTPSPTPSVSASATPTPTPTLKQTPTRQAPITAAAQASTAIAAKYAQNPWLGQSVGSETSVAGGAQQAYTNGTIFYSQATGAHIVKGAILEWYAQLGGPTSPLGFPTTDETAGGRDSRFNRFTNGSITWSMASGTHAVQGEIAKKWIALGAENSEVGLPITDEFRGLNGDFVTNFTNGQVLSSPATGTWAVQGEIAKRYAAIGHETSPLGLPISDEFAGANGARVTRFQYGLIIWTIDTGAWDVRGAILDEYAKHGFEGGSVGAPTSGEFPGQNGAIVQRFQNGLGVYTPRTGTFIVQGAILNKYAELGWEGGVLGAPTTSEFIGANGARVTNFENGQILWSPQTGAHAVYGAIAREYAAQGFEGGILGMPISEEFRGSTGARVQNFQGGTIIWRPETGAHAVYGAILGKYRVLNFENGPLGAPITSEFGGANGARVQNFANGQIIWSPATGANSVQGAIAEEFGALGWEGGPLGLPITDEFAGRNGARVNRFQNGIMIWTPRTGAFAVRGALLSGYAGMGYEGGALGAPTTNEFPVAGGWAQDFEHGRLTFVNGRIEVVWPGPNVDARCRYGRVMCISKSERKLRWMIDGRVLKEMDARFGAADTPTREGEFQVFSKVRDEISYMYGGTPMPFAMYFSGGEAVHYSYDFAKYGYAKSAFASHGCVNIRDWDGLQWLFDTQVRLGDRVVVYW